MLVAGEVALACALLVSSALLIRTVGQHDGHADRRAGRRRADDDGATVPGNVQTRIWRVAQAGRTTRTRRSSKEIRRQPGVVAAGHSNFLPLEVGWRKPFQIEGQPPPARPEDAPQVQMHSVSEGYFEAMGAALAEGRAFTPFDNADATGVVVVNESFAKRYLTPERPPDRSCAFTRPASVRSAST